MDLLTVVQSILNGTVWFHF